VSPVDETPDISQLNFDRPTARPGSSSRNQASSNIPVLRREKRRNQVATAAANVTRKEVGDGPRGRISQDPRWDPYSGEITTSDKGKPQSVKPGQFTPPGLRSVQQPGGMTMENQSSVTAPQKTHTSFGDRVRRLKSTNAPVEKPDWKGASGRVTLVMPVADQPDIPPISIPRKSSKRVASPHSGSPVSVIPIGETTSASAQFSENVDPAIRTVHSTSGRNSPGIESPISVNPDPVFAPTSAAVRSQARGQSTPTEVPNELRKEESVGAIERDFREALKASFPGSADFSDPYVQPPSRFSVTTYAPSEAHTTPRPSTDTFDRPPMPSPPQEYTTKAPSSILNRKRPQLVGDSPKSSVPRKAVNPSSPVFISMKTSSISEKRASNISKNLPQSPAEQESRDLVSSLQAQLDNLQHRRNNISRSIRQMTELMPQDNLVVTSEVWRKREEEKRKVEGLKTEEADIRRQEHDIGLRLHRAWKRRDKEAVYEPTGLWVRRVTG